ncbi:MAG: putative lipoprotein [Myxococcales bacterium]|nr:putative lipoprotein [Myxococcales bacterium]
MTRSRHLLALTAALFVVAGPRAQADAPSGSVKGTVLFEGEAPDQPKLKRDVDPKCSQDKVDEAIVVTKGKLRDVLVRIKNGTMGKHDAPSTPVVIDQRDCMYAPRVVGAIAGQKLAVRNSDDTFHNVHGTLAGKMLFNKPHAPNDKDLSLDNPAEAGDVLELQCDVHAWMHAYAVVQDHPFFAVTGEDGAFEIKGLPVGDYTLEAWHPVLGIKTIPIKIGKLKRGQVSARFSYKASDR